MSIRIYYDQTDFRLKGWREARKIINKVIRSNDKISGDLNFIITDDETIRRINIQFLKHDYCTDVITFDNNEGDIVNGEIYISIDTVRSNSLSYNVTLGNEIQRVMIHGVLHLLGYDDQTEDDKRKIHNMEDLWLELLEN